MNYLRHYLRKNKHISQLNDIFNNNNMVIDHLAHRTFKIDKVCNKYTKKYNAFRLQNDRYNFPNHNAYAEWWNYVGNKYENPYYDALIKTKTNIIGTPRIFISTYKGVYSDDNLKNSDLDLNEIDWHINHPNKLLSYDLYNKIHEKNQYLAWTLMHRNKINHIGIEVSDIFNVVKMVEEILFLNNPESPVQVSEDGNLYQFSTKSNSKICEFKEGKFSIPFDFIEFVERKNNREGFSEKNANVVFNSTS